MKERKSCHIKSLDSLTAVYIKIFVTHFNFFKTVMSLLATENEPLDTWDEEETILTPDADNDEEVSGSFL